MQHLPILEKISNIPSDSETSFSADSPLIDAEIGRKSRVIVCGYPKSGNSWVTRLVAEILRCPVVGYWCEPFSNEESMEGVDRESAFRCFKSHHSRGQLRHTLSLYGNGSERIIYVHRDPRAVVVSAAHYFRFRPARATVQKLLLGYPGVSAFYGRFFQSRKRSLDVALRGVVNGTDLWPWMGISWGEHVQGFPREQGVLHLAYEDLREDSPGEARRIAEFLGCERTDDELESAVEAQRFERKKQELKAAGKRRQARLLRRGDVDSWKKELSEGQLRYLEGHLSSLMKSFGYNPQSGR